MCPSSSGRSDTGLSLGVVDGILSSGRKGWDTVGVVDDPRANPADVDTGCSKVVARSARGVGVETDEYDQVQGRDAI